MFKRVALPGLVKRAGTCVRPRSSDSGLGHVGATQPHSSTL